MCRIRVEFFGRSQVTSVSKYSVQTKAYKLAGLLRYNKAKLQLENFSGASGVYQSLTGRGGPVLRGIPRALGNRQWQLAIRQQSERQ